MHPFPLRRLVVVVESTAALRYEWSRLNDYVEKIVRGFYGQDVNGTRMSVTSADTGLVLFNSHSAYNERLVKLQGWTSSMDVFLHWLRNIWFSGRRFGEVAMAEGLAEALLMCLQGQNVANVTGSDQKHVLLIATSAPCSTPTPVVTPPINLDGNSNASEPGIRPRRLAHSQDVAKWFPQCHVSLSVICPRRHPQLRSIFDLAQRNASSADPEAFIPKQYPHDTVLLSDGFWEARAALGMNGNISSVPRGWKAERHDIPITSGQTSSVTSRRMASVPRRQARDHISSRPPPVWVKKTTATTGTGEPQLSTTSSSTKAVHNDLSSHSNLMVHYQADDNDSQSRDGKFDRATTSLPPEGTGEDFFPGLQMGQAFMRMGLDASQGQVGLNTLKVDMLGQGCFATELHPYAMEPSNLIMTRAELAAVSAANSQLPAVLSQLRGLYTAPFGQQNPWFAWYLTSGSNVLDRAATQIGGVGANRFSGIMGTLFNIPEPTQRLKPSSVTRASHQSLQQHTFGPPQRTIGLPSVNPQRQVPQSSQAPGGKYARLWDGVLAADRHGQTVVICKLECYRPSLSPETLAADWPSTFRIMRVIDQDLMSSVELEGKEEVLAFRALNHHPFLFQLAEKKLRAVIELPSQTILLASMPNEGRMVGVLFPSHNVILMPTNANPQ